MPVTRSGAKIGAAKDKHEDLTIFSPDPAVAATGTTKIASGSATKPKLSSSSHGRTKATSRRPGQKALKPKRRRTIPKEPFPLMKLPNEILYAIIGWAALMRPSLKNRVSFLAALAHPGSFSHPAKFTALKLLSSTNKHMRQLCIPTLFRCIIIRDPLQEPYKDLVLESVRHLMTKPEILEAARNFILQTERREGAYHYETPEALLQCLGAMKNLEEIALHLNFNPGTSLVPMIKSRLQYGPLPTPFNNVTSMSFHTLRTEDLCDVFKLCPNLQNTYVEIRCCIRHCSHLKAVSELPNLKYLMLSRIVSRPRDGDVPFGWTVEDINQIVEMVPNIRHLALVGQLEDTKLSDYVASFAKFKNLEQLDMTDEQVIPQELVDDVAANLFFNSDDSDGVMDDMDDSDIAVLEAEDHWLNEKRETVAKTFFQTCPTLQRLFLGRCGSGQVFEPTAVENVNMSKPRNVTGVRAVEACHSWDDTSSKWQFGYPRVLRLNHIHVDV